MRRFILKTASLILSSCILLRDSRNDANELDSDLNQNPNLAIYRQTDNGLLIRMALFTLILGVSNQIDDSASPVNWFSNKS